MPSRRRRGSRCAAPPTAPRRWVARPGRRAVRAGGTRDDGHRRPRGPPGAPGGVVILLADYEGAATRVARARELREPLGDRRALARLAAVEGRAKLSGKRADESRALLEAAAAEFADLEGTPELAAVHGQLARAYFIGEDPRRAIEVADRVLETAEHADLIPLLADTLVTKGSALGVTGQGPRGHRRRGSGAGAGGGGRPHDDRPARAEQRVDVAGVRVAARGLRDGPRGPRPLAPCRGVAMGLRLRRQPRLQRVQDW